jgi:tripartite-type tricarboxylate transporter receptor subunit TctC
MVIGATRAAVHHRKPAWCRRQYRYRGRSAGASGCYTLLLVNSGNAASAALYDKLNFDLLRDIAPVAGIIRAPLVIEVNSSIPVKTVPELIAYAKANPGRVNYASVGSGTTNHITGELFKMMTGVNMVHVPYRGSAPALTAMLGGQVQVMFDKLAWKPLPSHLCR